MGLDIVRMRPAHCMRASPDARYALELNGLSYHEEAATQACSCPMESKISVTVSHPSDSVMSLAYP